MAKHPLCPTGKVLVAQGGKWEMDPIPTSGQEKMGEIDFFPGDLGMRPWRLQVLQLRSCHPEPPGNCPSVCPHTAPASSSGTIPSPIPTTLCSQLVGEPKSSQGKKHTQRYPTPEVPPAAQILGEEPLQAGIALTTNPQTGARGCSCDSRCKHPTLTATGMSQALFLSQKNPIPVYLMHRTCCKTGSWLLNLWQLRKSQRLPEWAAAAPSLCSRAWE